MINLLKSDFYRLVHGRLIWAVAIILIVLTVFSLWMYQYVTLSNGIGVRAATETGMFLSTTEGIAALTASPTHMYGIVFVSSVYPTVACGILVALALSADFENGTARNIWSARSGRRVYFAEKLVLSALIAALMLPLCMATASIACIALGMPLSMAESIGEFCVWTILCWLTLTAYLCITATVVLIARSKTAALIVAILLGLGIIGSVFSLVIGIFFPPSPTAFDPSEWLLVSNFTPLSNGAVGIYAEAGHIAINTNGTIAICTALCLTVGCRRDI